MKCLIEYQESSSHRVIQRAISRHLGRVSIGEESLVLDSTHVANSTLRVFRLKVYEHEKPMPVLQKKEENSDV